MRILLATVLLIALPVASCLISMSAMSSRSIVVWFRNDLRLRDNDALAQAAKAIASGSRASVLPIYVFDTRYHGPGAVDVHGNARFGQFRARFLRESVQDLARSWKQATGGELLIAAGEPEQVLGRLAERLGEGLEVVCHGEACTEEKAIERAVDAALKRSSGKLTRVWGSTMHHIYDLPPGAGVDEYRGGFTPWRKRVENNNTPVRKEHPVPTAQTLPPADAETVEAARAAVRAPASGAGEAGAEVPILEDGLPSAKWLAFEADGVADMREEEVGVGDARGVMPFRGGETAGLERLHGWMWDRDNLRQYFQTRNGMLGADYSSKFSPWLALGCLSPRTVYWSCKKYEEERVANKDTYWLVFELLWRDYFIFQAARMQGKLFRLHGEDLVSQEWIDDRVGLQAWKEGRTGWPLVDANMRELQATGFMSNRGRQNVASMLALDLRIDWRKGASHFEELLLDHTPMANSGNWAAAAGLGGGRVNRFNLVKQAKDYDPQGEYLRTWLPELKDVPTSAIHEPWKMSPEQQRAANCIIGVDYPNPLRLRFQPPVPAGGASIPGEYGGGGGGRRSKGRRNGGGGGGGGKGRRHKSDRRRNQGGYY